MPSFKDEFNQLYKLHFMDVYLFVKSLSHDDEIAQEITAETFYKALTGIRSFRGESSMKVWLCQIAKNTYFSHLKKEKRLVTVSENNHLAAFLPIVESPEETVITQEQSEQIYDYIFSLPEPYSQIFILRVFGEQSFNEIGQLYNKTANWACVTFYRARKQLMTKMEQQ